MDGITPEQLDNKIEAATDAIITASNKYIPKTTFKTFSNVPLKSNNTKKLEFCQKNLNRRISHQNTPVTDPQITLRSNLKEQLTISRDNDYATYNLKISEEINQEFGKPAFWEKINATKGNHKLRTMVLERSEVVLITRQVGA